MIVVLALSIAVAILAGGITSFYRSRGVAALKDLRFRDAEGWLIKADRSAGGTDATTKFWQARLYRKLGRLEKTRDLLADAKELGYEVDRINRETWYTEAQGGLLKNLEMRFSKLLRETDEPDEACEAFVIGCLSNYRLEEALDLITVWQRDYPDDANPDFLAGRIWEHKGDFQRAKARYSAAIEKNAHHAAAAFGLGRVLLFNDQQPEAALVPYRLAADHLYCPQPALVRIARCQRLLDRLDEARSTLARATGFSEEELINAYTQAGLPRNDRLSLRPAEYGEIELAAENWSEAERWFREALDANPRAWRVRYSLAVALRQQGETEDAQQQLENYNEIQSALRSCDLLIDKLQETPSDVPARHQVGEMLLNYVSETQGLIWLNSVFRYDPDYLPAHRTLAEYYERHSEQKEQFAELAKRHRAVIEQAQLQP